MTVANLFELFMFRKITILILLLLFNITAFFAYDWMSMNYEMRVNMQFPINEDKTEIVDPVFISTKYSEGSVMNNITKGVSKYKIHKIFAGDYFDISFYCEIKENCITASKLLRDELNNEAKAIIDNNKMLKMEILIMKEEVKNLSILRDTLLSSEEDHLKISEKNVDKAKNLDDFSSMLLLQNINNERQEVTSFIAKLNNDISTAEMQVKHFSAGKEAKHLYKWVVAPSVENTTKAVSFSLWLTLSFLMSIALYFIAAVLINTKQT